MAQESQSMEGYVKKQSMYVTALITFVVGFFVREVVAFEAVFFVGFLVS